MCQRVKLTLMCPSLAITELLSTYNFTIVWCTYILFKKENTLDSEDFLHLGPEVEMMFNERFQLLLVGEHTVKLSIEKKPIDLSYILVKFKTKTKFVRINLKALSRIMTMKGRILVSLFWYLLELMVGDWT